ncbi:DUF2259 domain-containing protein [Aquamicrobium sp. LC103]|uniref:DUF2259 domain-containing protein n=1 Tax=Aquamicrobium sp. LC103 TaxID=1120658 RepID=UPI00063E8B96|nr:DUF2259 domain-containing protein [Aquamicrobium sp. LC103]TKT76917.1 DUF2259 domain-containing protein [Aquamicrobium sp. LC103]
MKSIVAALVALAASAIASPPALAGDAAELNILGFSADGGIFAFEEFGIQDGSGFPYANRFYIDTTKDSFVAGAPIRVRLDDEGASVDGARAEAREKGQEIVADDVLSANRGFTAGSSPVTELSADPHRMAIQPRPIFPPIDEVLEFRVEELALEQPELCQGLGEAVGFRLTRIGVKPGDTAEIIHEDKSIPSSRGCPLGYRIGGVQTFFPEGGEPVFAVVIAIRQFGFEGPDHRWIAVTGRF